MATRLYPNTDNPQILEQLANVPPGTHAELTAIEQRHQHELKDITDFSTRYEIEERHYNEIHDHENHNIEKLYDFILSGYGRLRYTNFADPEDAIAGSTKQLPLIVNICRKHHLSKETIYLLYRSGGIHWS